MVVQVSFTLLILVLFMVIKDKLTNEIPYYFSVNRRTYRDRFLLRQMGDKADVSLKWGLGV